MRLFVLALALTLASPVSGQSRLASSGVVDLADGGRDLRTLSGRVERVRAQPGETGWIEVVVAGTGEERARTALFGAARTRDLPFAVGDVIEASIDCTASHFHRECSAVVRAGSEVILVIAPNGSPLSGWSQTPGDDARDAAPSHEVSVVLHRDGCPDVETRLGRWVSVTCADGRYLVAGASVTPLDSSVPDSSAYTWFAAARARTAPRSRGRPSPSR